MNQVAKFQAWPLLLEQLQNYKWLFVLRNIRSWLKPMIVANHIFKLILFQCSLFLPWYSVLEQAQYFPVGPCRNLYLPVTYNSLYLGDDLVCKSWLVSVEGKMIVLLHIQSLKPKIKLITHNTSERFIVIDRWYSFITVMYWFSLGSVVLLMQSSWWKK